MTGQRRRGTLLRRALPLAVCSLPLLVLAAVALVRWIA